MRAKGRSSFPSTRRSRTPDTMRGWLRRSLSTSCREAVDAASAKPFRTLLKVLNTRILDLDLWVKDTDLQGNHLHLFAHSVLQQRDARRHVPHPGRPSGHLQSAEPGCPEGGRRPAVHEAVQGERYRGGLRSVCRRRHQDRPRPHPQPAGAREGFKEVLYNQMRVIEIDPTKTSGIVPALGAEGGGGRRQLGVRRRDAAEQHG